MGKPPKSVLGTDHGVDVPRPSGNKKPEKSHHKKAAELVSGGLTGLDKVEHKPKSYQEYVARFPKLKEFLNTYKIDFIQSLQNAAQEARGTPLEANMKKLADNLPLDFENIILKLMQILDLDSHPVLMDRVFTNTHVPSVKIRPLGKHRGGTTTTDKVGRSTIWLSSNADLTSSYEGLRASMIHEFLHIFVQKPQAHTRSAFLEEGTTELLTAQVLGEKPRTYRNQVKIASVLFALDKRALLEWYVGGSIEEFKSRIIYVLEKNYTIEQAMVIAQKVINIQKDRVDRIENFDGIVRDRIVPFLKSGSKCNYGLNLHHYEWYNEPKAFNNLVKSLKDPDDFPKLTAELRSLEEYFYKQEDEYYSTLEAELSSALVSI